MSNLNRAELISKIGDLCERVAGDPQDQAAVAELDALMAAQPEARAVYLDYVWMQVQMRSSVVLTETTNEQSPDSSTVTGPTIALASTRSNRQKGLLMAGVSAVALCCTLLFVFSDAKPPAAAKQKAESSTVATVTNNSDRPAPNELITQVPVENISLASNNLAHPGNSSRVTGGVIDDGQAIPEEISFNLHVRSILSENCYYCHGPDPNHRKADLRLDTAEGAEYVFDVDSPEDSELILRVHSNEADVLMPPPESGRVLSSYEKMVLERWIAQGAEYETHWAFIAPKKPAIPNVAGKAWPRNEIDHFTLSKLEQEGIEPAPRAEPHVIARRLYLDLIGLPPTIKQVETFVSEYSSDSDMAIDALVDQLLSSPHYGERMALPWLDAARYSDSNGFQQDGDRHQWPWRDWVVQAMNDNMPFDQFTIEQLAGDLLPSPTNEQLIATGFNRNHMLNGEGGAIAEEQRNNYVFDRVDTTATTWLGLTMACCQCHDHKYDPLTQKDYYSFFAYFNNVDENGGVNHRAGRLQCGKPYIEMPDEVQKKKLADVKTEIDPVYQSFKDDDEKITAAMTEWEPTALKEPPKGINRDVFRILRLKPDEREGYETNKLKDYYLLNFADEKWKKTKKKLKGLENKRRDIQAEITTVMVMKERDDRRPTNILIRGEYESKGDVVEPAVPAFLPKIGEGERKDRLALAQWFVDPENPLTSRVTVNRFWQTFFAIGLVKTAEDFGVQGELPSHPELLDWLAVDFVEHGWDVKRIYRMIVTSETYLQSGRYRKDLIDVDPENRLLARSPRFRLPSLLIRDAALSVAGLLNTDLGGKPVYPYQPPGLWKEFSLERFEYETSTGSDLYRRSLYTFWRRTVAPPNLFDSANRQTCIVKSSRTNTPLHALVMLNDPTFVEASCCLAQKVIADEGAGDDESRLRLGFSNAMGRLPEDKELSALKAALDESREYFSDHADDAKKLVSSGESVKVPDEAKDAADLAAYASVMQIILNTDEFMTRE